MELLLILLSIAAALVGFLFFISEATMGVGIIGIAAILAMFARIAQAEGHHKKSYERLGKIQNNIAHLADKD